MLTYEDNAQRLSHASYFPPKVQIKDYNVKIDEKSFFNQVIRNYIKA